MATSIDSGFPAQLPTEDPLDPSGQVKTTGPVRKAPTILEWNLTVQRELAQNWMLSVGYVGTRATGIWNNEDSNLDQPTQPLDSNFSDPTGNMGRPYFSVLPNLSVINPIDYPNFNIFYNGLESKLEKRFSNGFTLLASYTWSHDIGSWQGAHSGNTQIADDANAQSGDVDPDFRQRFTASYTYDLPFGRDKAYGGSMNSYENAFVGGWQVAGITTVRTGEHYTAFWGYDPTNTGTAALPDEIHNPYDFSYRYCRTNGRRLSHSRPSVTLLLVQPDRICSPCFGARSNFRPSVWKCQGWRFGRARPSELRFFGIQKFHYHRAAATAIPRGDV